MGFMPTKGKKQKTTVMKKFVFIFTIFTIVNADVFAQKNNKKADSPQAKVEQSLVICDDLPYQERSILGVVDFNVTASGARGIGRGMSDMLSNALVECNCFRVVERERLNKIYQEQELRGVDPTTAAQANKLTGAQLLVMGNITEFQEKTGGVGGIVAGRLGRSIGVGAIGKTDAHVGMIIKVINATTGEILLSKSLERKVTKVGALGGGLLPIPVGGAFYKSKAMEDAIEETILEAVALIAKQKNALPGVVYNEPPPKMNSVTITVTNTDFKSLMNIATFCEDLSYVKNVEKKLNGNKGLLMLDYTADLESLLIDLVEKSNIQLEVVQFDEDTDAMTLALK